MSGAGKAWMRLRREEPEWVARRRAGAGALGGLLGLALNLLAQSRALLGASWEECPEFDPADFRVLVQAMPLFGDPALFGIPAEQLLSRVADRLAELGLTGVPAVGVGRGGRGRLRVGGQMGLGDALMLGRYVACARSAGWEVDWEVAPALVPLLAKHAPEGVRPIAAPSGPGIPLAGISLLGLPLWLAETVPGIPPPIPWVRRWRVGRTRGRPRIGLVWQGNPTPDPLRSLTPEFLAAVLGIPGIEWVSMQVGSWEAAWADGRLHPHPGLPPPVDFAATARALMDLDACVSVDTSMAHLAGTVGLPTWVLLRHHPSWIWGRAQESSPWYEGVRLVRQPSEGDWEGAVRCLRAGLAEAGLARS